MSDTARTITLADILADNPNTSFKVSLEGPNWEAGDTTSKYPSLRMMALRIQELSESSSASSRSSAAESEERGRSLRSRDSSESIIVDPEHRSRAGSAGSAHEQGFHSQFLGLLGHQLRHEIGNSYKTWADRSANVEGGCCVHHKARLDSFMKTATFDVALNMIWLEEGRLSGRNERPEWLEFKSGGQTAGLPGMYEDLTTQKPASDQKASDFPCEYATAGGSLWDNCLVQSAVGRPNCQFPLSELLQNGTLGLDIEATLKTPAPLFTDLRPKWTVRKGSLDITSPEMTKLLRCFEPISTAYINEVKKEVSRMRGWTKETHRTNLESAMNSAKEIKTPTQSHWQVPYPFSVLKPKLVIVERDSRSRMSK